jgi:hypothetical protein
MQPRYCIRLFRRYVILSIIGVGFLWLVPSIILKFNKNDGDLMGIYGHFVDNHIYPPPWYISNWTMNDYFIRNDEFRKIEDQIAIDKKQKVAIENDYLNRINSEKVNYLIVEYTTVFYAPKFCAKTQDFIFGKQCPYQNCR